jgi:hypothetical protein
MVAEQAETCSAVTSFKKDLILNLDIVACWTVNKTENSSANYQQGVKIQNYEILFVHSLLICIDVRLLQV